MKQVLFITIFLLLFLTGLRSVDAKWIPENATPQDVERLVQMEQEEKARIIREQQAEEQKQEEVNSVAAGGTIEGGKEAGQAQVSSTDKPGVFHSLSTPAGDISGQAQVSSTNKPGEGQQQSAQGVSGVLSKGQTTAVADKGTKELTEAKKIQKSGWKDWLAIGFFLIISIGCLILYFFSMNKSGCRAKCTDSAKNTASKGLTLLEIMVATAVITMSVLCILRVFRYASLVQPQTGYSTKAMILCEEKLEEIRNRTYNNLITGPAVSMERISMGPYGWNGTTPINGGATRTIMIKKINEVWDSNGPTFNEVTVGTFTYLKAKVKMEWGRIPIRNGSGTITGSIPLKREMSIFIAPRS
ncbi:hypothetical protein HY792_04825 [Candidatus Desantisbacteria bacterium]|nr:hypothetical protein [Candidatus Desantisbacteria bacterium]